MELVVDHLKKYKGNLEGDHLSKSSGYEKAVCEALRLTVEDKTYWDCYLEHEATKTYIEIKKSKSDWWLDTVRYAKILRKVDDNAKVPTLHLFIRFSKNRAGEFGLKKMFIVDTNKLIEYLKIDHIADMIIEHHETVQKECGERINCQRSIKAVNLEKIADGVIEFD